GERGAAGDGAGSVLLPFDRLRRRGRIPVALVRHVPAGADERGAALQAEVGRPARRPAQLGQLPAAVPEHGGRPLGAREDAARARLRPRLPGGARRRARRRGARPRRAPRAARHPGPRVARVSRRPRGRGDARADDAPHPAPRGPAGRGVARAAPGRMTPTPRLVWRVTGERTPLGALVVDRSVAGRSCGGVRAVAAVDLSELADLARTMTFKFAFLGIACGGAKAGVVIPPD